MDKLIKAKWISALRSGEYKQARGQLRAVNSGEDAFCCLGVLCEITKSDWPNADWAGESFQYAAHSYEDATLPPTLREEYGIDEDVCDNLASMNDGNQQLNIPSNSFAVIADYIEENL